MQREFERLLGSPLAGIRIHTDPAAAELAASEQASAFTIGHDIVFGKDRFAPGTQRGRMLLAHELAHTLQQSSRGAFAPPSVAETEARAAGSAAAHGRPGLVQSAAPVGVQKEDDDEIKKQAKPPSKPKAKAKSGTKKAKKPAKAKPWTSKRAKASTASTASRREKTMSGMTPDQRRQVEILERYAEGAEKAGKDRIGRTPKEEEGVARTKRGQKSEKQRHVDPMKRVSGHHGFPQYLGGKFEQTLISLGEDLHYLYHQELDLVEKIPRKFGSKHYKNMPPAEREELFRRLIKHAQEFDKKYSKLYPDKRTRIAAAVKRGIREAGFKVPSTGKKAKAGTGGKKRKGGPGGRPREKPTKAKPAKKAKASSKAKRKGSTSKGSPSKPSTPKPTLPKASAGSTPARAAPTPSTSSPSPSRIKPALKIGGGMVLSMAVFWWLGKRAAEEEERSRNKLLGRSVDPEVEKFLAANQAEAIRLTTENPMAPVYLNVTADFDFTWERQGAAGTPTDEHVTDIRFQGIALSQENIRKQQTTSHESFGGFTGNTTIWETRHITYSIEVDFGETEEELHGRRLLHDASRIARRGISARSVGEGTHWGGKDLKAWERRQDDERRRWGLPTLEEQRAYDERQRWVEAYVEYTAFHGPDDLYADAVRYLEEIKRRPRPIPGEVLRPR